MVIEVPGVVDPTDEDDCRLLDELAPATELLDDWRLDELDLALELLDDWRLNDEELEDALDERDDELPTE